MSLRNGSAAFWLTLALSISCNLLTNAQELSEVEKDAIKKINIQSVTSAVTFLSSDEMRGRDTPSLELNIASAYVAARFRGAGLVGISDKENFYQVAEIDTVAVPSTGVSIVSGGKMFAHDGLVSAGPNAISWTGKITSFDNSDRDAKYDGAVIIENAESFEGRRGVQQLNRRVVQLKDQGAKIVLVKVPADHQLIGLAKGNQNPTLFNPRRSIPGPVLLVSDVPEGECTITIPARIAGKTKVRNVIGVIPGSDPELSKEAVIFSAHLDHIGTQSGLDDPIFNGADDNATGVTGVVSLADAFAAMETKPKRTTIFMTFWGEEKGLLGSYYFSENPLWPLDKVTANINIEMIGRPENGAFEKAWMTGWDQSDLGAIMAESAKRAGVEIFQHPQFSGGMLYQASDNFPFVKKGVVAHSFSAGSLHDDYHGPADHWEKLELAHMTKVIQGLFVGSMPIVNGEKTPQKK